MTRGVRWYLVSSLVLGALIALAGCSHYLLAEREPWRHEAELSCLNSGAVKETPERVRISAVGGAGACGIDYPLRISALGDGPPLSYDDEAVRPPGSIPNAAAPNGSMPKRWPGASPNTVQSNALPPVQNAPQSYPATPQPYPASQPYPTSQPYQTSQQTGQPLSLNPPGLPPPEADDLGIPGGAPHPYYGMSPSPSAPAANLPPPGAPLPALGPPRDPMVTAAAAGPVTVQPPATLACPIVSALDQWIDGAVQPAALHWFRQPVVGIKQISAYSCRGMNGDPSAHISEHAFGNALDIAEFDLADGHKISVQYGWKGTPEEQGFLHDVQSAACDDFTTVLAPGANVYHYNHIHVDLMRHYNGRHICEPNAIPGEVVAERVRSRFAAQHGGEHYGDHYNDPGVTGSIKVKGAPHPLGFSGEDDDRLPLAEPGGD
jgi:hypothetical protein